MTLGVTKKVSMSGEVRLGSYWTARLDISYRIILLTAYFLNCNFLFSTNPVVQPISLVKVRARCGVDLGVIIFVAYCCKLN